MSESFRFSNLSQLNDAREYEEPIYVSSSDVRTEEGREIYYNQRESLKINREKIYLACFSSTYDTPNMWAH